MVANTLRLVSEDIRRYTDLKMSYRYSKGPSARTRLILKSINCDKDNKLTSSRNGEIEDKKKGYTGSIKKFRGARIEPQIESCLEEYENLPHRKPFRRFTNTPPSPLNHSSTAETTPPQSSNLSASAEVLPVPSSTGPSRSPSFSEKTPPADSQPWLSHLSPTGDSQPAELLPVPSSTGPSRSPSFSEKTPPADSQPWLSHLSPTGDSQPAELLPVPSSTGPSRSPSFSEKTPPADSQPWLSHLSPTGDSQPAELLPVPSSTGPSRSPSFSERTPPADSQPWLSHLSPTGDSQPAELLPVPSSTGPSRSPSFSEKTPPADSQPWLSHLSPTGDSQPAELLPVPSSTGPSRSPSFSEKTPPADSQPWNLSPTGKSHPSPPDQIRPTEFQPSPSDLTPPAESLPLLPINLPLPSPSRSDPHSGLFTFSSEVGTKSSSPTSDVIENLSPGQSVTIIVPVTPNIGNYQVLSQCTSSPNSICFNKPKTNVRKGLFKNSAPNESPLHETKKIKKKKRCDRRNCCFYCDCILTNLTRHMTRKHAEEKEVAQYLALLETCPKESKGKRASIIEELRIKGNFRHNVRELKYVTENQKADNLLPLKRPAVTKEKTKSEFITCSLCQSLLGKKSFFKHAKFCLLKEKDKQEGIIPILNEGSEREGEEIEIDSGTKNFVQSYGLPIYPESKKASVIMKKTIFPMLHKDKYGLIAMNDDLIVSTCNDYLQSHPDPKDRPIITRKMRDAAKLLSSVSTKCDRVTTLKDMFFTSNIDTVIKAVQELCICSDEGEVGIVGMPARLSWVIFECGKRLMDNILSSDSLLDEIKKKEKNEVKNFLDIVRRRWKYYISTNAERSRTQKKMLKEKIIPPSEDVQKFGRYLRSMSEHYYKNLKEKLTHQVYNQLCKVTIAQIITLNARRPLEAAKIKLRFFLFRPKGQPVNPKLLSELTEEEKKSYDYLSEFYVPGKNGQDCSVLLTKDMERHIELIVQCREFLNIPDSNKYLFARPGLTSTFDGSAVMRELRSEIDLSRPQFMTANGIRHHHATMGTLLGQEFTSKLSNHMSHTLDVHNKNYCYPLEIVNRGKVGNFLLGLQGVNLTENSVQQSKNIENESEATLATNVTAENNTEETDNNRNSDEDWLPSDNDVNYKRRHNKRRWSDEEKRFVVTKFVDFIRNKKNPGPLKCKAMIEDNPILASRTPCQVNTFIDNINKGKLKLSLAIKDLIENI